MPKNPSWSKEEDDLLIQNSDKSIKELMEILNRSDGAIRNRKTILGIKRGKCKPFTEDELNIIREWYTKDAGVDLESLSKILNRDKATISGKAKSMGLTRYAHWTKDVKEHIMDSLQEGHRKASHPKGMLGKKHSKETLELLSKINKDRWAKRTDEEKHDLAMKSLEGRKRNGTKINNQSAYSNCKGGFREDLNQYFRSAWEANIARILNYSNIQWKYEPHRFYFSDEVEVISYLPDFYLPEYDLWIEVKGWFDDKSIRRLKLFKEYYPDESKKLIVIDNDFYFWLLDKFINKIDTFEQLNNLKKYNSEKYDCIYKKLEI